MWSNHLVSDLSRDLNYQQTWRPFPLFPVVVMLVFGVVGVVAIMAAWKRHGVYLNSFWRIGETSIFISAGVLVLAGIAVTSFPLLLRVASLRRSKALWDDTSRSVQAATYAFAAVCGLSLGWLDDTAPYQREWVVALVVVGSASVGLQAFLWRRLWRLWQLYRDYAATRKRWVGARGRERAILHIEARHDSDDLSVTIEWPDSRTEAALWNPHKVGSRGRWGAVLDAAADDAAMKKTSDKRRRSRSAAGADDRGQLAWLPNALLIDRPSLTQEADSEAGGGYRSAAGRTRLASFGDSWLWRASPAARWLATAAGLVVLLAGVPPLAYAAAIYFSM
ncbi:MAG: hypothetical protein Tsb0020_33550 [Haliangiales bacterium]